MSKPVLKTIAAMDLDKINMDLVESLLEWIVDGPHDYPPGETGPQHPQILHTQQDHYSERPLAYRRVRVKGP